MLLKMPSGRVPLRMFLCFPSLFAILAQVTSYKAPSPRSSLRMRIASSTRVRKIFPSPILPVRAATRMACTAFSTIASASTTPAWSWE